MGPAVVFHLFLYVLFSVMWYLALTGTALREGRLPTSECLSLTPNSRCSGSHAKTYLLTTQFLSEIFQDTSIFANRIAFSFILKITTSTRHVARHFSRATDRPIRRQHFEDHQMCGRTFYSFREARKDFGVEAMRWCDVTSREMSVAHYTVNFERISCTRDGTV